VGKRVLSKKARAAAGIRLTGEIDLVVAPAPAPLLQLAGVQATLRICDDPPKATLPKNTKITITVLAFGGVDGKKLLARFLAVDGAADGSDDVSLGPVMPGPSPRTFTFSFDTTNLAAGTRYVLQVYGVAGGGTLTSDGWPARYSAS
jgi:hypothetical protein